MNKFWIRYFQVQIWTLQFHSTNKINVNIYNEDTLQEKSFLASTKVDAKYKKLSQKPFFASTFWLPHSDAINRIA